MTPLQQWWTLTYSVTVNKRQQIVNNVLVDTLKVSGISGIKDGLVRP